jgi:hypothetical protein
VLAEPVWGCLGTAVLHVPQQSLQVGCAVACAANLQPVLGITITD